MPASAAEELRSRFEVSVVEVFLRDDAATGILSCPGPAPLRIQSTRFPFSTFTFWGIWELEALTSVRYIHFDVFKAEPSKLSRNLSL